MVFLG